MHITCILIHVNNTIDIIDSEPRTLMRAERRLQPFTMLLSVAFQARQKNRFDNFIIIMAKFNERNG